MLVICASCCEYDVMKVVTASISSCSCDLLLPLSLHCVFVLSTYDLLRRPSILPDHHRNYHILFRHSLFMFRTSPCLYACSIRLFLPRFLFVWLKIYDVDVDFFLLLIFYRKDVVIVFDVVVSRI